jgi:hypothetical protein
MHGFIHRFVEDAFTPEQVEVLVAAFDAAWTEVMASNAPWAQPDYREAGRTILAKEIIAAAKAGETNPQALTADALLHLSRRKLTRTAPD